MTSAVPNGLFQQVNDQRLGTAVGGASFLKYSSILRPFRYMRRSRLALGQKGLSARLEAFALGVRRVVYIEYLDPNLLLTPEDLHERGWTSEAMIKLLGRPDYAVVDPSNRRDPVIALDRRRVEEVERSAKFRAYFERFGRQAEIEALRRAKWASLDSQLLTRSRGGDPSFDAGQAV